MLAFDESSHRYTLDGKVIPSVTQIIGDVFPGWQADEWYMAKGSAMHHGCRLIDEGRLDWTSVAPEIVGRLRAWERFRADYPAQVIAAELPLAHPLYRFAGTLDRVFLDKSSKLIIADIKSTIVPQVKVQLAAYKLLRDDCYKQSIPITSGAAVELRDNGTYSAMWLTRKELELSARTFLAALTVYNWKKKENQS